MDATLPRYAKMNGIGNEILVLDLRGHAGLTGAQAQAIGRRDGFGFDQLMALREPKRPGTEAFVEIFNQDGSLAGACGNGTRCVAWYLLEGRPGDLVTVETQAGLLACRRDAATVFTVDMGAPLTEWHAIPLREPVPDTAAFPLDPTQGVAAPGLVSALSMGNPHAVFWLDPAAPPVDMARIGSAFEHHPMFPERANISFARVLDPHTIRLDVWERGAGATKACGSAACATLVAAVRTGRVERRATILLPGGVLDIEWRASDGHVLMSGPVELEHAGRLGAAPAAP